MQGFCLAGFLLEPRGSEQKEFLLKPGLVCKYSLRVRGWQVALEFCWIKRRRSVVLATCT